MSQHKRIILVSGMGTSPAVLTNTVWGLAHQKHSIVPDEIVVFITKSGKKLLIQKLFDDGVWNEMRTNLKREKIEIDGKLVFGATSIRVIPDAEGNEIEDLRTGETTFALLTSCCPSFDNTLRIAGRNFMSRLLADVRR